MPALADGTSFIPLSWARQGDSLLGQRMTSIGAVTGIVRYRIVSGRYDVLYEDASGAYLACVALEDGRYVLTRDPYGIFLIDTTSRQTRRLLRVGGQLLGKSVGITRDQRWITFTETAGEGNIWLGSMRP